MLPSVTEGTVSYFRRAGAISFCLPPLTNRLQHRKTTVLSSRTQPITILRDSSNLHLKDRDINTTDTFSDFGILVYKRSSRPATMGRRREKIQKTLSI